MKKSFKPPPGLLAEAKAWWRRLRDEYSIEDAGGLLVLASAAEAFHRMRQAQEIISVEGMTTKDRFQQAKVHPAVIVERDSRASMLSALRALNLDLEPLHNHVGRPGGTISRR